MRRRCERLKLHRSYGRGGGGHFRFAAAVVSNSMPAQTAISALLQHPSPLPETHPTRRRAWQHALVAWQLSVLLGRLHSARPVVIDASLKPENSFALRRPSE
jgi:hypothetical protein